MLLNIKFAKYQIYFNILPTFTKNFNGIKWVWLQPQKVIRVQIQNLHIYWLWIYPIWFNCFNWIMLDMSITFLKFFLSEKHFFTLIAEACHYPWGYFNQISENKTLPFFIILSSLQERETRCVNFKLDLHVLLRL